MPFISSVRGSYGAQGRFGRSGLALGQYPETMFFHLDPSTIGAGATTISDSTGNCGTFNIIGSITKSGTYQIARASGNRWGISSGTTNSIRHVSQFNFGLNPFTLEMWIYISQTTYSGSTINNANNGSAGAQAGWRTFFNNGSFWSPNEFNIYIRTEGTAMGFATTSENGPEFALNEIGIGWHHIAAVRDNVGRKLYVDGVLKTSDSTVHNIGTNNQHNVNFNGYTNTGVGYESNYGDQDARFGNIRAYNSALSQVTISQLYNVEKFRFGL